MIRYKQGFSVPRLLAPNYEKPKKVSRAAEISQMRKEGMTMDEIADALGVTRSSIQSYMRRYQIR